MKTACSIRSYAFFPAFAFVVANTLSVGCTKPEPAPSKPSSSSAGEKSQAAVAEQLSPKKVFEERCAPCHGSSGKGDGAAAAALNPKPRNYSDKAWQASVTDEQIRKTIVYGGAAVGKSAIMPSSPDLDNKPEVVEGLVKIVRAFGGT